MPTTATSSSKRPPFLPTRPSHRCASVDRARRPVCNSRLERPQAASKTNWFARSREGLEIYPAEERLVDSANQFHLWVFASPIFRFPIGFRERLVAEGPYRSAAQQRPCEPGRLRGQ